MYTVVGCSECDALWIVEDRPETTRCRRCGTRHRFEALKAFAETEAEDAAREARSRLLADRSGRDVEDFASMGERVDAAGPTDEEYLAGSGLDPDEVAAAGDRVEERGRSQSRRDVLDEALRELDAPTEDAVVRYAEERGVPAEYVRDALAKLSRTGELTKDGDEYRPV